jgi:hypothetical protein
MNSQDADYLMNEQQNTPPPDEPRGHIQLRLSMARKNAYVRAAKPGKLTAWIFRILDRAAGFSAETDKTDSPL